MLGEFVRPEKYDQGIHFERFAAVARDSNVPRAFGDAYLAIVNQIAPHTGDGEIDYARFEHQAVSDRLLNTRFSSRERAEYALMYGNTISTFKEWNHVKETGSPYLPELRRLVERSARAMLHIEQNFANPDNTPEKQAVRRALNDTPIKRKSILSTDDLADVRTYIENHFEDNRNQAKILLLGE